MKSEPVESEPVDVDAFNASFRGELYGDAPVLTAERFTQTVERNAIDLTRSPRWVVGGMLLGVALLGFREKRAWVGGFGIVPEFRGRGLARRYLEDVLAICRDAGAETLELEVLLDNAPAIALYERGGFATIDELVVWSRAPVGSASASLAPLAAQVHDACEIARVARTPPACWQREAESVATASPCERLVIGGDAAPQAYAFLRRSIERVTLLDAGAYDRASAELLLDAIDGAVPQLELTLLNEPARGPLHEAFAARLSWREVARQHRMRRSI